MRKNSIKIDGTNLKVYNFNKISSTNLIAGQYAGSGCDEGVIITAKQQTAGKGRLGRTFLSQKGGIYFSVVLRPTFGPNDVLFITVAAAVAAARAIESVCGKKCDVKWVNDIYVNNKKVCGILTEGTFKPTGEFDYAILGVGINLFEPKKRFPKSLPLADSVFHKTDRILFKKRVKRKVLCEFTKQFFNFYNNISKKEFINEYQNRSFLTGKDITYKKGEKTYTAQVIGVDNNANLVVSCAGETHTLSYGEIQIVGMEQLLI